MMGRKPGGLSCRKVAKVLQSHLDDELDEERRRKVAAHLDECERCGLEAEVLDGVRSALRGRREKLPVATATALREFSDRLIQGDEPLPGEGDRST
jgi:anti-sigma factor RsiW